MKLIIDIFSSILEVLVLFYFFSHVLADKRDSPVIKVTINLFAIVLFTLISSYMLTSNLAPGLFFIVMTLYCFLLFKDRFIKKLLYSLLMYVLGILAEVVVGVILSVANNVSIESAQDNVYFYLQGIIISKLLLFFIFRTIGLYEFNNKMEINAKSILSIFIIPLSSVVNIYYFANIAFKTDSVVSSSVLMIVTALTIISNVAIFYLLEGQMKLQGTEEMLRNMEKQYKIQADYYTELKQNMLMSNKNVHDIKNFIVAISSYIDSQKTDKAQSKIEEFYRKIPNIKKVETGNDAVNALVQSKLKDVNEEIPNNTISIMIPEKLMIDDIDLCILIGNALDNAVEACKKLVDKKSRKLAIKIFPINGQLSMLFVNSKTKSVEKNTGIFRTTKSNSIMHGFGIENMKSICHRYNGTISFEQTEERFMVSILLPN